MSILKIPYELSLWEDRLTFVCLVEESGKKIIKEFDDIVPDNAEVVTTYFKEIKICTIGSDSLESPVKAIDPNLTIKIDGTNTLTFSIYAKYYDEESEEFVSNPYLPYLVNERKVKLKTIENEQIKWRDFIIKKVSEDSENYFFTYTATDLFINELSKSGYSLQFDTDLKNNTGTITCLADKVLEGSSWVVDFNSEPLQDLQEEALYKMTLKMALTAYNMENDEELTIPAGEIIYIFYSSIVNFDENFFQFLYKNEGEGEYLTDDNRVIINARNCYAILNDSWEYISENLSYTPDFRGERVVRSQQSFYEPTLERQVQVYLDENDNTIFGYSDTKCITEQMALSYITNGTKIVTTSGWLQKDDDILETTIVPNYKENPDIKADRKIVLKYTQTPTNFLYNSGLRDNKDIIEQISLNEPFIFRTKVWKIEDGELKALEIEKVKIQVKSYKYSKDKFEPFSNQDKIIFEGVTSARPDPEEYLLTRKGINSKYEISKKDLQENKYGIFITIINEDGSPAEGEYCFEEVQFFRQYEDENFNVFLPDGKLINLNQEEESITEQTFIETQEKFYFYYPQVIEDKDSVKYQYIGKEEIYTKKYNYGFEKIRSITASESNRFNLLQQLAEIFQCQCEFDVKHKETGEIELWKEYSERTPVISAGDAETTEEDIIYGGTSDYKQETEMILSDSKEIVLAYCQRKIVRFHKKIGQIGGSDGIKYGINLKKISRDVSSDEIVTKLIVKNNDNEFAQNGFCSIARARDNMTGETFILNLDYYVQKGFLNYDNLQRDLYSLDEDSAWIGYFPNLKKINTELEDLNLKLVTALGELDKIQAEVELQQVKLDETSKLLKEKKEYFYELTSQYYDIIAENDPWLNNKEVIALREAILQLILEETEALKNVEKSQKRKKYCETQIDTLNFNISTKINDKEFLNNRFERKYSRFIQEGSWSSEEYIDDSLYYLDAESTLYNSAKPKIEYTIDVVELSQLEGYQGYFFNIGDITWIQDPDFFGWVWIDGDKTPYKEKIIITEISTYYDSPDRSRIKVCNYNSQFDALFQRYTAAVQKIELNSGAYAKAASVIETDGTIASKALETVFSNNTNILKNAKNQSVVWDDTGITTSNLENAAEKVRVTSGGIFLTNDGGNTWTTGITGNGINAKAITTGQLNTNNITILNGDAPSFRWDAYGISAFVQKEIELTSGERKNTYDNRSFVRFDQYGLYGIKDKDNFIPKNEQDIRENATFALTWSGFMLRTSTNKGSITIDSETDFTIWDAYGKDLIRIGRLNELGFEGFDTPYGISIKDDSGEICFLATPDGLVTGGWSVTPQGLYSLNVEGENQYMVGLYSKPLKKALSIAGSEEKTQWRFVAGEKFGVDFSGNLYAAKCNTDEIVFRSKDPETGANIVITLSSSGIEITKEGQSEQKKIQWESLLQS